MPWRMEWLPTPVFLPGESHGQRSLLGYCPWGHKESDMIERLTLCCSSLENTYSCIPSAWDVFFVALENFLPVSTRYRLLCYAQSCPTLCHPMDCSLPGSSVHGILQERILEWVAIFLLQGIFLTQGSNPGLGLLHCRHSFFIVWATREVLSIGFVETSNDNI